MRGFPGRLGAQALFLFLYSVLPSAVAAQQPAPDCSRAKTAVDRAICAVPELKTADASMAEAYSTLPSALPGGQRSGLLADQRRWLRERDATCSEKSDRDLVDCLLAETDRRRRLLAGEGPNLATGAPRPQPAFFQEMKKARYEIDVVYPHIAKPNSPAEISFNKAAHELVPGKEALSEIRGSEPVPGAPGISSYGASYDVTYLDPRLASIVFTIYTYGAGAAHPNIGRESLVFDFSRRRALTMADLVGSPAGAISAISEFCKGQLKALAAKDGWELFDDADFAMVVRDLAHWAPGKAGVDIMFDPYSIAAYVFGPHECRLSWSDLSPWLKPDGPLPPGLR